MSFVVLEYDKTRSEPIGLAELNRRLADGLVKPTQIVVDQTTGEMTNVATIQGVVLPTPDLEAIEPPLQFVDYPRPAFVGQDRKTMTPIQMAALFMFMGATAILANSTQSPMMVAGIAYLLAMAIKVANQSGESHPRSARLIRVGAIALIVLDGALFIWHVWPKPFFF